MTRYRLKNRELQQHLDEASKGQFSSSLHQYNDQLFAAFWGKTLPIELDRDKDGEEPHVDLIHQFRVMFPKNEVEEIPEYDPRKWNSWPEVQPPKNTLLRAELKGGICRCMLFDGSSWYCATDRYNPSLADSDKVLRFRPWDDPEDDE